MARNKESSGHKKDDSDDCLSSYLNMKSPLLGQLEFDVSVLPPPVDPKFLDYEVNDTIVKYEVTGLELLDRFSSFSDFNSGIADDMLQGLSFTGCGIENRELMESLESGFFDASTAKTDASRTYLKAVREDVLQAMKFFQNLKMDALLARAKESLPVYLQNLLSSDLDMTSVTQKKLRVVKHDDYTKPEVHKTTSYDSWGSMSLQDRVEAYVTELERTFVGREELVNPKNRYARAVRVYRVLPNTRLSANRYIQVGIDGVTLASESRAKLEVDGVLKLSKETQTQRYFEYYKRESTVPDGYSFSNPSTSTESADRGTADPEERQTSGDTKEDFDYLFDDEGDAEAGASEGGAGKAESTEADLYKFIRQYSSQKVTKSAGSENYYLLTIPDRVMREVTGQGPRAQGTDDGDNDIVEVLPIRGPKVVFSKAGVTKRPDIRIAYTNVQ